MIYKKRFGEEENFFESSAKPAMMGKEDRVFGEQNHEEMAKTIYCSERTWRGYARDVGADRGWNVSNLSGL